MMGGGQHRVLAMPAGTAAAAGRQPGGDRVGSDLARDAGINDIGSSGRGGRDSDYGSRQGIFEQASNEDNENDIDHNSDGFDGDGDGDSDYA